MLKLEPVLTIETTGVRGCLAMLKLKPVLTVEQRVLPCVRGSLAYVEAETNLP